MLRPKRGYQNAVGVVNKIIPSELVEIESRYQYVTCFDFKSFEHVVVEKLN